MFNFNLQSVFEQSMPDIFNGKYLHFITHQTKWPLDTFYTGCFEVLVNLYETEVIFNFLYDY